MMDFFFLHVVIKFLTQSLTKTHQFCLQAHAKGAPYHCATFSYLPPVWLKRKKKEKHNLILLTNTCTPMQNYPTHLSHRIAAAKKQKSISNVGLTKINNTRHLRRLTPSLSESEASVKVMSL